MWLELDNLANPDGRRGEAAPSTALPPSLPTGPVVTNADVPPELLALLPLPPETGWPEGFRLKAHAESLHARAKLEALITGGATTGAKPTTSSGVGDAYPLLRRAERLSYAVWAVIGAEEGAPLQRVLEATSTAERLRFAVLRCRRMTGRSFFRPSSGGAS